MNHSLDELRPDDLSVAQLQDYVLRMCQDRGFRMDDVSYKLVMLMEETGELAKAVRKAVGGHFADNTKQTELAEELADVQIVLLGLANMVGVDMREAVLAKETKNEQRVWKSAKKAD